MDASKIILFASIFTVMQAGVQIVMSSLAIVQYFCVIDFLQQLPILLYIRILYFHNPSACGPRITIGHAIDNIPNQAFVLLQNEPLTTFRTFVLNCTNLGLGFIWLLSSVILISEGAKREPSVPTKWPWILSTIAVCTVDVIATVIFANDSFYTKTLSDIMDYTGGLSSGLGSTELDTYMASWIMVAVYSRFVIFFLLNVVIIVLVAVKKPPKITNVHLEAQVLPPITWSAVAVQTVSTTSTEVQTLSKEILDGEDTKSVGHPPQARIDAADTTASSHGSVKDTDDSSFFNNGTWRIPRAHFNNAFLHMKKMLFDEPRTLKKEVPSSTNFFTSTPIRSPSPIRRDEDIKRSGNFPENILSLRKRLENIMAKQQRRLDQSIIDTSARHSPPRSAPHLSQRQKRRGTLSSLQGQMPWAYVPTSAHRMRDQLPPDEDLPPVPLPDYTAIPSFRKTSVHRATSSLSSLTHKRDYTSQVQRSKSSVPHIDALY